jgi:hypothetical protein
LSGKKKTGLCKLFVLFTITLFSSIKTLEYSDITSVQALHAATVAFLSLPLSIHPYWAQPLHGLMRLLILAAKVTLAGVKAEIFGPTVQRRQYATRIPLPS